MTEDTPQNAPQVVGTVDPQVRGELGRLHGEAHKLTHELGLMDLRMNQVRSTIGNLNEEAQKIVEQESKRLGIPEGVPWQISQEGNAIIVGGPTVVPPQAPPGPRVVPDPAPSEDEPPQE